MVCLFDTIKDEYNSVRAQASYAPTPNFVGA